MEHKNAPDIPDYALITDELILDAYYNVNELGTQVGKLTVHIEDHAVTAERLSEILLEIRACFDRVGVGFYAIDCVLEHLKDENGFFEDGQIEVMDFLYTDIHQDGLMDRVMDSNGATNAYYQEQDAEKPVEKTVE